MYQVSDITLVGGSFFSPKKQLVHGTNRIMSDEKLLHVVLSGSEDEECQEECQEECHDLTNFCLLTLL